MESLNSPEEISVAELLKKLRELYLYLIKRIKVILLFSVLGLSIGLVFAYTKRTIYTAKSSFVLEEGETGPSLGQYAGIASMVGIDLSGGSGLFQGDNIIQLYESRTMLVKTLLSNGNFNGTNQKLIDRYIGWNKLREKWDKDTVTKGISFNISQDKLTTKHDSLLSKIVEKFKKSNLLVEKPDKKLSIIEVSFTSEDQLFAKEFIETLVDNVNQFYIETKTKKATENIQILQHQTDSVRQALNSAIAGVAASVDLNPNPNQARQVLRVSSQRRNIDVQANSAILQELVKNLELAKVSLRRETPLIQIIDNPVLPLPFKKLSKIKGAVLGFLLSVIMIILYLSFMKYISSFKRIKA